MSRFERCNEIIYDLLHIQQERAMLYEKFIHYPDQDDALAKFLTGVALHSRNSMIELRGQVDINYGDPADRVEVKGDLYRDWPGIKSFPPDSTPQDVYLYCEYNEKETARVYKKAIASSEICEELRQLLSEQLKALRTSFKMLNEWKERPTAPAAAAADERMPLSFSRNTSLSEIVPW